MHYDDCLVESRRAVITRWRFSHHNLHIETGRYKHPKIPREERRCNICPCVEDEEHVIFHCALYNNVRVKHVEIFTKYAHIQEILNPKNVEDAYQVGSFLLEVEKKSIKKSMMISLKCNNFCILYLTFNGLCL